MWEKVNLSDIFGNKCHTVEFLVSFFGLKEFTISRKKKTLKKFWDIIVSNFEFSVDF